jgi:hypothetical protein
MDTFLFEAYTEIDCQPAGGMLDVGSWPSK